MLTGIQIEEGSPLHKLIPKTEMELKPLTILMGPNGAGKSSVLRSIAQKLTIDPYFRNALHYKQCADGITLLQDERPLIMQTILAREDNGKYRGYFGDDISSDVRAIFMSEGQSIMQLILQAINKREKDIKNKEQDIVFLIDEIDSGLSFDNVLKICTLLTKLPKDYPNIQFIMTAHNYEFARLFTENVFWVPKGKYIDLSDYPKYSIAYELAAMVALEKEAQ